MKKEELKNNESQNYNKSGILSKIPSWLKILLLKYWAAGAAFYFFGMAAGFLWYSENEENNTIFLYVMLGLGYALTNEYIVKQIVRLMRTSMDDTYYYNMINLKGTKSFFLNLLYSAIVMLPLFYIFGFLGSKGIRLNLWGVDGIDPLIFALGAVIFDFIYLFIKNAINNYLKKKKYIKNEVKTDKEL